MQRMLSDGSYYLAGSHLYKLCLMHASVYTPTTQGIIRLIAQRIHTEFAEPGPCLTIVIRYGYMRHIPIGEHIVPHSIC